MSIKPTKLTALILGSVSLAACSSTWNTENDSPRPAQVHPISVDTQVVTMELNDGAGVSELSSTDEARLRAFATAYLRTGDGALTITTPDGGASDFDAQERAADIREVLYQTGVPYSAMKGASYRNGGTANGRNTVLSFSKFVATASPCGIWRGEISSRFKNLPHPNFGCADQNNLAAMIANPRDLVVPADETAPDAASRARAIKEWRDGNLPTTARDQTIELNVSGN